MGLKLWATLNGAPIGDGGPILTVLGGQVVMGELGQANPHSLRLAAADERTILAMQPYTLVEIEQDGLGTIGYGYVRNPVQQITDRDESTITLELESRAIVEGSRYRTHRGWIAANFLSTIAARLGALIPGWYGTLIGFNSVVGADFLVSVNLNNPTAVGGFFQVAKMFAQYAREARDVNGVPLRGLEMGQFGAAPTKWIVSGASTNLDDLDPQGPMRVAGQIEYQPNDVRQLYNVAVPFGGGNDDATLVTLERLWRIINDPAYPNFGRYGPDADSIARTGLSSVFPQYDPAYPISNPQNLPTGRTQWAFTDQYGNPLGDPGFAVYAGAAGADGYKPLYVYYGSLFEPNILPVLSQGAVGTRYATLDGHFDYMVYDAASYATYGHHAGQYIDSNLTYADQSPANQELTEIALYLSMVSDFKRYSHPHQVFTATIPGTDVPTKAGDLITVDYQRSTLTEYGAVVEMAVTQNLRVMKTVRNFPENGDPPYDDLILSNLGRFDEDDSTNFTDLQQQMIAVQLNNGTGLAPFTIGPTISDVDAANPMHIPVAIPSQLYKWLKCSLRIDFQPYHQTTTTAQNQAQGFQIVVGSLDIALPATTTLKATATVPSTKEVIGGVPTHKHRIAVPGASYSAPSATPGYGTYVASGGILLPTWIGNTAGGYMQTNDNIDSPSVANTTHGHSVPIDITVFPSGSNLVHIPSQTVLATLPQHIHPLDQKMAIGPLPAGCIVYINGVALTSGLKLNSGSRDGSGIFTSSVEIDDVGPYVFYPGQALDIQIVPTTSAGNPFGVGRFQVSGTWFGEFGGLTPTIRAA